MKNTNCILVILILLVTQSAIGQPSISGFVMEKESLTELMYSTISVYKEGKLVTGTVSDEEGYYEIEGLKEGTYEIEISYVGYNAQTETVLVSVEEGNALDRIHTLDQGTLIQEVIILEYKNPSMDICIYTCRGTATTCSTQAEKKTRDVEFRKSKMDNYDKETKKALIFPNPTRDYLQVKSNEKIKHVSISDVNGRQLLFRTNVLENQLALSVHNFLSGTYFMRLYFEDGSSEIQRFVKVEY